MTDGVVQAGFETLLDKLERERGFASASYKQSFLLRRIRTRMRSQGALSYESYIAALDRDPREMDRLVEALTINVTRFFRNRPVWDAVAEHVVPSVWGSEIETIRVWSAGCATGEEALTMAMLFHRHAAINGMLGQMGRLAVTGSDVDGDAVAAATRGCYSDADLAELDPELRRRYFSAEPPFRPAEGIRRCVRFARHDLLRDPDPTEPQHIILCRNVLIYFERSVQQQLIERFREALAPGGYLILGKVESLLGAGSSFQRVAAKERIFRKLS
jgi:chemotaxis methyl-accepting protein methylase